MKKLICLLLTLWLPISASSAWAMSMQMQVGATLDTASATVMDMPCHDMAMEHTDSAPDPMPGMKHNCAACAACFSVFAAGTPLPLYFTSTALTSRAALAGDDRTVSQTYPPALRPPIAS